MKKPTQPSWIETAWYTPRLTGLVCLPSAACRFGVVGPVYIPNRIPTTAKKSSPPQKVLVNEDGHKTGERVWLLDDGTITAE
jgi:hypothetical protein